MSCVQVSADHGKVVVDEEVVCPNISVVKPQLGSQSKSFGSDTASLSSGSETQVSETFPHGCESSLDVTNLIVDRSSEILVEELASPKSISDVAQVQVTDWDGRQNFSDLIHAGLVDLVGKEQADNTKVHMVYECPSTASHETSFRNGNKWKVHDYPPSQRQHTSVVKPLKYTCFSGNRFPTFLAEPPSPLLVAQWQKSIPAFVPPAIVQELPQDAVISAYMPMEQYANYVYDPEVHFRVAGKDVIHEMTERTTRLLKNTRDERPCVAKVTHAMGSLGIFVIRNDDDEQELFSFLEETGNPDYVVSEFVDIDRNMASHFFVHPQTGNITWIGCSENLKLENGVFSSDTTFFLNEYETTKDMMVPYTQDVAQYLYRNGFWGMCGIDVLFDPSGEGYTVDVNPRVTGSMPSIMIGKLLNEQDPVRFAVGKFRKSTKFPFAGSLEELMSHVDQYNDSPEAGKIVILAAFPQSETELQLNLAAFGSSNEHCEEILGLISRFSS